MLRPFRSKIILFSLSTLMLIGLMTCKGASGGQDGETTEARPPQIKNVILLIGDGMGLAQVSSSFYFGATQEPNFVRFPVIGLINTSSAKQKVTDSAAGATAFGSGIKTYNGAIGVDVNGKPAQNMTERLSPQGIATGVVATSTITHATPACFYSHVLLRSFEDSIAMQLPGSGIDFFAGGGRNKFAHRLDGRNLLSELAQQGFQVDTSRLGAPGSMQADQKYGYLLSPMGMPSKLMGRDDFLPNATALAIEHLSQQKDGFFLMVEGSQIDWESHYTNVQGTVLEVRDFDKAIGVALDFAEQDGETLVIVTADHETGGFALSPPLVNTPITPDSSAISWKYDEIEGSFYENADTLPYSAHTASLIPVFAFGPGAQNFAGIYQNNDIFHKIVNCAKW